MEFENDMSFQQRMRPAALKIYSRVFSGCHVEDLRTEGVKVHILDKEFGIDSLIHFPNQQWISIQEKYRRNSALKWLDFTQEYKNAVGTQYEANGEWFKLGAQLYFYGWADELELDFVKWVILDIAKYKLLVEKAGGLSKIGKLIPNKKHGRASFFAIPINKLEPAFLFDYRNYEVPA